MSFKIKNWKLATLAIVFFFIFILLGCWQLSRASEKRNLLETYEMRMQHQPITFDQLNKAKSDLRFFRIKLTGKFDNKHTFLLDNKTQEGQIGYEVYTPFFPSGSSTPILINRGFIPIESHRRHLPSVKKVTGKTTIHGLINLPPAYYALGQINESTQIKWPLLVEYIELQKLDTFLKYDLYQPYIIQLADQSPGAYQIKWHIVTMQPQKHTAYAIQWFAFALTLLVLFFALNRR